ncbi:MAG: type VI secretion system tip protein TssI/VgrG [Planctomycetota bacterium]
MAEQADRPIEVTFDGQTDDFLLRHMTGTEQLGRLFEYKLDLLHEKADVKLEDVLGKVMVIRSSMPDGTDRYFHGHVSRFSFVGMHGNFAAYQATLRPWLWFLTRTSNCRIFENKTIPEIVKKVFEKYNFSDFDELYNQTTYNKLEYCVQYRESDFNFVSRLLEQAGIYYYFKHEESKHTLVLSNGYGSHATSELGDYGEVPYFPPTSAGRRERDHVSDWYVSQEIQPCIYAINDYDFERPTAGIDADHSVTRQHERAEFEVFDYPGEYVQQRPAGGDPSPDDDDAAIYVESRIHELQAQYEKAHGSGDVGGLFAGVLFSLTSFPRQDQNREYLVESITHELNSNEFDPGGGGGGPDYECSFVVIDAQQTYRSPRVTPKPVVQGCQTATVVEGEQETDKYGRIRVQFPWDREGMSSCWVRVAQISAGPNWGTMFIPYAGHEVVIEFLEGDPDRPICTGSVYNADNMPPMPLADHNDQSLIRDAYGNELVFVHTPGEEHLELRSPHHQSSVAIGQSVKFKTSSDRGVFTIGNSDEVCVGNSKKLTVGHDSSYTFGSKFSCFGGWEVGIWAGASLSVNMGAKCGIEIGGNMSAFIGYKYTYTKSKEITAGGNAYVQRNASDILFDSQKTVYLAGGPDRNSIVMASPKQMEVSFGTDSKAKTVADGASAGQMLATQAATAFAAYQAAESSKTAGAKAATAKAKEESPAAGMSQAERSAVAAEVGGGDQDKLTEDMIDSASSSGKALVLSIASAANMLRKEDVPSPKHDDKKARLYMNKDGIQIEASDGKSPIAFINISKDGEIGISNVKASAKPIKIFSKGEIVLDSKKPIKVQSKEVQIKKGSVKMKNFEDKG